jgi:hypothetical protein
MKSVSTFVVFTLASAGCFDSPVAPATASAQQAEGGALWFDRLDGSDVVGTFEAHGVTIGIESHADKLVDAAFYLPNAKAFVSYDPSVGEAGTLTLDVSGDIEPIERDALGDLAVELDRVFPFEQDPDQRGGALLRTYAGLLEDWTIGPIHVVTPIPLLPKDDGGGDHLPDPKERPARNPPPPPPPPGTPPPAGCQVSDDDGVSLLYSCCGGGRNMLWQHDGIGECFTTNSNFCGANSATSGDPLATACPGRCGPGCSSYPVYTQDCLDHDLCLMHHTTLSSTDPTGSCGDELIDGIDDFAFIYFSGIHGWWEALTCGS